MGESTDSRGCVMGVDGDGEYALVELFGGKGVVKVDPEDYADVSQYTWYAIWGRQHRDRVEYARRSVSGDKKELLHRYVIRVPAGVRVDHKNGDGLDCRKANLRVATAAENVRNQRVRAGGYKGVSWEKRRGVWRASIGYERKSIHVGYFKSRVVEGVDIGQIEAARAYDDAAIKYFGSFACLNFPAERNICKLKDGLYRMSPVLNDVELKKMNRSIGDMSRLTGGEIYAILAAKPLEEILAMCRFLNCGVQDLVKAIKSSAKGRVECGALI